MDLDENFSKELARIVTSAASERIYGSIEIYFENGVPTQITQRIINKLQKEKTVNVKVKIKDGKATISQRVM